MKEKILFAIKKHFYNVDGTPEKSAQEIDTLTKEHYMRFISWLRVYCVGVSSKTWLFTDDQNITLNLTDEQAYQYWLTNISKD
jgi:hypothetical protein